MAADGSIVIEANVDDKNAQKELNALAKKISKLEEDLNKKKSDQSAIGKELEDAKNQALKTEQAIKQLNAELRESEKITSVSESSPGQVAPLSYQAAIERQAQIKNELAEQENILKQQDKETEKIANQYAKITDKVIQVTESLNTSKNRAGELSAQLAGVGNGPGLMSEAVNRADAYLEKFTNRVRNLARRVFVFTLITMALRSMRDWFGKVIKTNGEATAAIAKLKGALLTLAQPLVNVIIPAFTAFVNVLARLIASIAKVLSMLFGGTIQQSRQAAEGLRDETDALEGMGGAADEAGKSMASFDEINQLSGNGGGEGGGAASSEIAPDFEFDTAGADGLLKIIGAIGAALLAWRISSALGLGLQGFLAMLLAIYSAVQFVKNLFDAWVNGVSWDNLLGMILSAAGLAAGLGIALGPVAAGISLIVTGLAMLATGFHDAFENGWNLQNLLLSVAGILATGIGIGLLTGSWIPLLIGAVAAILLAVTAAYGEGENLLAGVKQMMQGFLDFFKGIFTGDLALTIQGIGGIFGGLNEIVQAVLNAVSNMFNSFLDWLDEKTHGKLSGLIEWIRSFITGHIDALKTLLGNVIQSIQEIFTGLVEFISGVFTGDWDLAWEGIKDTVKGAVNLMISLVEGFVNIFISAINSVIERLNTIQVSIPSWVPVFGGKSFGVNIPLIQEFEIPRLAAGAVIPPNREFLAVLGDQKSGTNIEAPESLIRKIVREETAGSGFSGEQTVILQVDREQLGKVVYRLNREETRRIGVRLTEV